MSDLVLDLKRLAQLKSDLDAIAAEFKNADEFSDDTAHATGHDELESKVKEFAHNWNDKRQSMTDSVESLVKSVGAITDGFTQVDDGLSKALAGDGASGAAGSSAPAKSGGPNRTAAA